MTEQSGDLTLRFELESHVRFIKYAEAQDPEEIPDMLDVWHAAFRAGMAARTHPRTAERLRSLLHKLKFDHGVLS